MGVTKPYVETKEYREWIKIMKKRLKDWRIAKAGMSQEAMAEVLGRRVSSYRRLEKGEVEMGLYEARLFCKACGISLYQLNTGEKVSDRECTDIMEKIHYEVDVISDPVLLQSILQSVVAAKNVYNSALRKGAQGR